MRRVLLSFQPTSYWVERFFRDNPSEDFVCIDYDTRRYSHVIHRTGRFTFGLRSSAEELKAELENSLSRDWHGNMYELKGV